jgi:hypothetical protein
MTWNWPWSSCSASANPDAAAYLPHGRELARRCSQRLSRLGGVLPCPENSPFLSSLNGGCQRKSRFSSLGDSYDDRPRCPEAPPAPHRENRRAQRLDLVEYYGGRPHVLTFERTYRGDNNERKTASSFNHDDLLNLAKLAERAEAYIATKLAEDRTRAAA